MSGKQSKVPVEELSAYERWELPAIGNGGTDALQRARAAAKRQVKPLTAEDLEKIRQEAYQAGFDEGKKDGVEVGKNEGQALGYKEGHSEGVAQGLKDGKTQIDASIAQLYKCLQGLANPIAEQRQIVEQAMLNVSLAISRAVIHRELKLDSSQVAETVTNAIHSLPDMAKGMKVYVNPVDFQHVEVAAKQLGSELELAVDRTLQPGGCRVETSSQLIDYTIEKRFQKTVHAMLFEASKANNASVIESPSSINELSDYSAETLDEAEQSLQAEQQNQLEIDTPEAGRETPVSDAENPSQNDPSTGNDGDEPA